MPDSSPVAVVPPTPQPVLKAKPLPSGAWASSRGLRDDSLSAPSFAPPAKLKPSNGDTDLEMDDGPPRKKSRPDFDRIRPSVARSDASFSSVPPSSRVSVSSTPSVTPTITPADDPLSPVVGKLRKDVSRVKVGASTSDSDADSDAGKHTRRRVVRGRRKDKENDDDELPSPRNVVVRTLESDNDEREGIIDLRSSPPPVLSGRIVNGKLVNGSMAVSSGARNGNGASGSNGKAHTSSKSAATSVAPAPVKVKAKAPTPTVPDKKEEDEASSGTEFGASDDEDAVAGEWVADEATQRLEREALKWFNDASEDALVEVTGTPFSFSFSLSSYLNT